MNRNINRERGASTVVIAAILGVAIVACLSAARLGVAAVARARADAAADAAALAAADMLALGRGSDAAATAAQETAGANGGTLTSCRCSGGLATVRVTVPTGLGGTTAATARAEVHEGSGRF